MNKLPVYLFFVIFVFLGLNIAKDYGVPWDEGAQRNIGEVSLQFVLSGNEKIIDYVENDHGPVFEMFLSAIERLFCPKNDIRAVYFMRHRATFLLFYVAVIFFYLLCNRRFQNRWMGLAGSAFLVLSPRIFADSFYNSKDIPFLSLFIISAYTLLWFLDNKTVFRAFIHALVCAILVDIRILGVLVPFLTIFFVCVEIYKSDLGRAHKTKIRFVLLGYVCSFVLLVVFFWPALWEAPWKSFIDFFSSMAYYKWGGSVLYLGDYIKTKNIPWHYIPVWIAVTTPLAYLVTSCLGYFYTLKSFFSGDGKFRIKNREDFVFIVWFSLPLLVVFAMRPILYDAWRHMFFIYPALVYFSLAGIRTMLDSAERRFSGASRKAANAALIFLIMADIAGVVAFMVKYHPHQNVYFNILAGENMDVVKKGFELDYWGLSYRQGLEYILRHDKSRVINIFVANYPGKLNYGILDPRDKKRLVYVSNLKDATYFLTNYRWHKEEYDCYEPYYAVKVRGAAIMTVCKRQGNK